MRGTFVVVGGSIVLLLMACSGDDEAPAGPKPSSSTSSNSSGGSTDDGGGSSSGDASSSSSSGGTNNPTDCAAAADGLCSYLQRCIPDYFALGFSDVAACKARGELSCNVDKQSPGAGVVPTTCATDLKALACSGFTLVSPASCRVKGTLADGAVCENDVQCTSGACVKAPGAASPCGKCTARAGANGSCANGVKCDWDFVCATGDVCKTPAAKDAACVKGQCLGPLRCIAGTCKDPIALSMPCTQVDTEDDPCDGTKLQFCKRTNIIAPPGMCTAIQFVDAGQPCGVVGGNLVGCKAGASCEGPLASKTCQTKAADNAACDSALGPTCTDPAECINGKCTIPPADRCK